MTSINSKEGAVKFLRSLSELPGGMGYALRESELCSVLPEQAWYSEGALRIAFWAVMLEYGEFKRGGATSGALSIAALAVVNHDNGFGRALLIREMSNKMFADGTAKLSSSAIETNNEAVIGFLDEGILIKQEDGSIELDLGVYELLAPAIEQSWACASTMVPRTIEGARELARSELASELFT